MSIKQMTTEQLSLFTDLEENDNKDDIITEITQPDSINSSEEDDYLIETTEEDIVNGSEEDNYLLPGEFANLDIEKIRFTADEYKEKWLTEIHNMIAAEIFEKAKKGINVFETECMFPIVTKLEEPNYNCKLYDTEIKRIIRNFEKKGFKIRSRKHLHDHVKFLIKY